MRNLPAPRSSRDPRFAAPARTASSYRLSPPSTETK